MLKYNPQKIERKWQKKWYDANVFLAKNFSKKKKFFALVEFPYPSGDGLHVGHCRSYTALDIIARKKRMEGFNVLYPMGWDAFGLPTENYAIKMSLQPAVVTKKNTENFKKQMKSLGLSFDWSREINTTDPKYYKWTQWIFLKLFEKGLAYKDTMAINWCPKDKIGLANEEVVNGQCERCGTKVEKREKEQWLIKITKYADRLLKDLDLVDYPERVKIAQKEWIGKSEGAEIEFSLDGFEEKIKVFTTRPDTIFGCTFLVVAPEKELIEKIKSKISNWQEVQKYIGEAKNKSDLERQETQKEKTGIELKGIKAINPANKEKIPVFIADYVMVNYGTGTIMAVPADDKRDEEFATKFNLPVVKNYQKAGFENFGKKIVNYKLRDWIFSRQHYWGEPIPMIFCDNCRRKSLENPKSQIPNPKTAGWIPVPEKDLPVELPKVKKYQPTDTGESPLAIMEKWVNVKCPNCKGPAKRETDTMPNWAGSNWYYLRYADPKNNKKLADEKLLKYWMPVDWYNGGMEHTTLHLLYSRFIFKFLYDIGAVPKQLGTEPYKKRTSHGVILGEGGIKMSKSRGNIINPDDVVKQYGADTLRIYEMFVGPFEQMIPWDEKGIVGARRFLNKVYQLCLKSQIPSTKSQIPTKSRILDRIGTNPKSKIQKNELTILIHKTIKKIGEDIEAMKFNTAISSLMVLVNHFSQNSESVSKNDIKNLLLILSPFAPHVAEELWQAVGFKGLCSRQLWPTYNEKLIKEERVLLIVQINGKVRDKMKVAAGTDQKEAEKIVFAIPKIKQLIEGDQIHPVKSAEGGVSQNVKQFNRVKKIIFVKDKLINIVL